MRQKQVKIMAKTDDSYLYHDLKSLLPKRSMSTPFVTLITFSGSLKPSPFSSPFLKPHFSIVLTIQGRRLQLICRFAFV